MGKKSSKAKPKSTSPVQAEVPFQSQEPATDKLRLGLLAATVGTFVVRPLIASESAVLGDGLVLVMLLLLIGLFWAIGQVRSDNARIRFTKIDAAILLLVGLYTLSGLIAIPAGNTRAVLNMVWLWIGLVSGYFLLRQLVDRVIEARVIVAVMIALAVAVASHGLYQYCWEFPQMRAAYAENPDAMLRAEGMWYPPGSPERIQFDNRINSREPLASFALTNSLAGFLAPWLIIAGGLLLQSGFGYRKQNETNRVMKADQQEQHAEKRSLRTDRIKLTLMLLVIGVCFILTKSRTAWAAVALGVLGLGLWWKLRGRAISMKWVLVAAGVIVLLVGIAIAVGGLDSQVIGEAGKSLKYRFEYWQATTKMIAAEPWFGTGPGRYQETYSQFKLPEASEEPADPHNFLFEIAATAGLFALATMVAVIVLFVVLLFRRRNDASLQESVKAASNDGQTQPLSGRKVIYLGALFGYLASFPIGAMGTVMPDFFVYWGALPIGVLALFGLDRWTKQGTLSPTLLGIAWGVLLVNLLAAGGISFPGVATSFWVLLALGIFLSEPSLASGQEETRTLSPQTTKNLCSGLALVAIGLLAACYFTAYGPVLAAKAKEDAATRQPHHAETFLLQAAEADPWSAEPWIQLANLAYVQWQVDPTPERFERFLQFNQEVFKRNPNKSAAWFFCRGTKLRSLSTDAASGRFGPGVGRLSQGGRALSQ